LIVSHWPKPLSSRSEAKWRDLVLRRSERSPLTFVYAGGFLGGAGMAGKNHDVN